MVTVATRSCASGLTVTFLQTAAGSYLVRCAEGTWHFDMAYGDFQMAEAAYHRMCASEEAAGAEADDSPRWHEYGI